MPLKLKRGKDFFKFICVGAFISLHHARNLHRDRGGADAVRVREIMRGRADHGKWIYADMVIKKFILKQNNAIF